MSTRPTRRAALAMLALIATLPSACGTRPKVTVFAAASLKESLEAAADAYEAKTGKAVTLSFGASSTLAKQIEQGARADLFFSADTDWMDYLQKKSLIDSTTRRNLLGNHLVIVATGNPLMLDVAPGFDLAGALKNGKLAVADPVSVPAGKYAKAALTKLDVWDKVSSRIVPAENTRAALEYVVRGEVSYGIVYGTDAMVAPTLKVVGVFPDDSHPAIVYPVAMTRSASPDARAFFDFLGGPEARGIFDKAGFSRP